MNLENVDKWFQDDGDNTLSVNYLLAEDSLVYDVGGYEGNWSGRIIEKYNPFVFIFEPVEKFFTTCKERFKDNPKVHVLNYGLSDCNVEELITLYFDSSGMYIQGANTELVVLRDVGSIITRYVDLISINIEGGEYSLLTRMLDSGAVKLCRNIQVQFHDNIPDYEKLREEIRSRLRETHVESYCYPFVWESWKLVQT